MNTWYSGLLGFTLASAVAIASANAADMYRSEPSDGSKGYPSIPFGAWAGFYAGINGGYAWNQINEHGQVGGDPGELNGGFGGGQIGYNWQRNHVVFGIEADIQGAGISHGFVSTVGVPGAVDTRQDIDYFGTVRGRLGYSFGPTLVYATAGFAYGGVKDQATVSSGGNFLNISRDETETGFVAGGGLEYKFNPAWSIKTEYQYVDLGSEKLAGSAGGLSYSSPDIDGKVHTVRVGLNYHLNSGYVPLK
jgi:outer membrane immunogenic protein